MPGGQVISPDYNLDLRGVTDALQTASQAQLMNQLLQQRVQAETSRARLEDAQMQSIQQEVALKQQTNPALIQRMQAEANLTQAQVPLVSAQAARTMAEIPELHARAGETQARTGLIGAQTGSTLQQQSQASQLFPSELSLSSTKAQMGATELNKAIFDNVMERIQKTDSYKDYLDSKEAGKGLGQLIAAQHPEIDKRYFSLYGSAMGAQKAAELGQTLEQSKQMDLQNLQLTQVLHALPQIQQQHKLEGFMGMLNQSLSSPQPDAAITALLSSPTFKNDPDMQPVVESAQRLYSKFGSAKNMENMITAGLTDPDPAVRQGALITQYAWHGKRLPTVKVPGDPLDPMSQPHEEIDVKALQGTDPFLAKYAKMLSAGKQPEDQGTTSGKTTVASAAGSSQDNPIVFTKDNPYDKSKLPALKGKWVQTASGQVVQVP